MAIVFQHQPNPALLGQAANLMGQEQRARYEAEQQRLNDQFALAQAQFAEQQRQNAIGNQFRYDQLGQQNNQFNRSLASRMTDAERARQVSMASQSMQEQNQLRYLGLQGAQQWQRDLARYDADAQQQAAEMQARQQSEMMQQQAINQRTQMSLNGQAAMQRYGVDNKQMLSEWGQLQQALPRLDEDQRQQAIGNFQDRWSNAGQSPPVALPEPPEDPFGVDASLRRYEEHYAQYGMPNPFYRTEDGSIERPRGDSYQADPAYWRFQEEQERLGRTHEFELAEQKRSQEQFDAQFTARQKYADAMARARADAYKNAIETKPASVPGGKETQELNPKKFTDFIMQAEIMNRVLIDPPTTLPIPQHLRSLPWVMTKEEADMLPAGTHVAYLHNGEWKHGVSEGSSSDENTGS